MATQTAVLDDPRAATGSTQPDHPTSAVLTPIEVTVLGGFEVRVGGRAISSNQWSRRHSVALVKLLALAPGRSLHRERVLDALWPDLDIDVAAPRLHKAAHYARKALGLRDAVMLSADTVQLGGRSVVHVDAERFQVLARSALDTGGITAAKTALAVYGGGLLPHDLYEPWVEQHRLHLARLYMELLHQAELWHQALATDPADEPAHLALAQRYAESGDRAAALRQLDQLDQVMRDELGLEPSQRAAALRRRVLVAATHANDPREPCCAQMPEVGGEGPSAQKADSR